MKQLYLYIFLMFFSVVSGGTFYVDCVNGNDDNDGRSRKMSFKTISKAAESVSAGDTVLISSGVYHEHVSLSRGGKSDFPITFRGEGEVIITAADRDLRENKKKWVKEDAELNIYSTSFSHDPIRLLAGGYEMFPYSGLEQLKKGTFANGYPATLHGFFYDEKNKKLFIRFRKGQNPENSMICASPEAPAGSNAHHIWKKEHGNFHISKTAAPGFIRLENLIFETPAGAGVVTLTGNTIVKNCTFRGCRFGVSGIKTADNVFVENCTYTQKGIYNDVVEIIRRAKKDRLNEKFKFYFWAHKTVRNSKNKMINFETGILGAAGKNWHLRNCLIEDSFEGFSCWGPSNAEHLQVYGNTFCKIVDNAIETENSVKDIRIYNNFFEDVFEPVSWQPLAGPPWPGPVFVYRNIIKTTDEFKVFADSLSNFMPGVFKIGISGRNWQYAKHGNVPVPVIAARKSKRFVGAPDPGFLVFNNTIIHPYGGLMTTPQPLEKRALRELVNFRFFNNIISVKRMHISNTWKAPLVEFYNNIEIDSENNSFHRGIIAGDNGKIIKNTAEIKLKENYKPDTNSPALKAGMLHFEEPDASIDCGAVPQNSFFDITCGAGTGKDIAKFSEFRKKVHYHPELIRSAGPEKGCWAVYSFDKKFYIQLKVPKKAEKMTFIFRPSDCTLPHDDIIRKWSVFSTDKYSVTAETDKKGTILKWKNSGKSGKIKIGNLNRDEYHTVEIIFGRHIFVNGRKFEGKIPSPSEKTGKVEISKNIIYDVKF